MYDIRQFRPALYTLLILGMTGFAMAAQSPGIWVLAVGGILLNGWLVKTGRFMPLPRFLANLITMLSLAYIVYQVRVSGMAPILVIGQFLVLLQLVKLFEQRANRDFAQLLVLSLLLIVAASINTASLYFGILLIVYLFLSLYCCLLFHLKVETDHAKAAIGMPEDKLNPATLRQDQRYLSRSMRRLTGFVSLIAVAMAVVVFLFFPRGTGAGLLGPLAFKPAQTLSGFSDQVSFQNIAAITQNNAIIAHVKMWHNGEPVTGPRIMLLRGTTLNVYRGSGAPGGGAWTWVRSASDDRPFDPSGEDWRNLHTNTTGEEWTQEISLQPTGTVVLFALPGATRIRTDLRFKYSEADEVLQAIEPLQSPVSYRVISRNSLDVPRSRGTSARDRRGALQRAADGVAAMTGQGSTPASNTPSPRPPSSIDPKVEQFARLPEVSGSDAVGPLASRRNPLDGPTELDLQIAANFEKYLKSNFRYTLDLTDAAKIAPGQDPLVAFLYDIKRGHCEYFAGAMALMCQSLGMEARVVVGFKFDEFNNFSNAYVVRQSHAHAWVEVRGPRGWETFDPTSGREDLSARATTTWQKVKHFFDYLEYTWATSVVAYDRESRGNMIRNVDAALTNSEVRASQSTKGVQNSFSEWFTQRNFLLVSSKVLSGLIYLMVFAVIGAIGGFLWEKWKLRRRAKRIGLDGLPSGDKVRLARQLGFYDELMRLLERHRIYRPRHLTPMEFSHSITFLPIEAYEVVRRLTHIFYRIRYGGAQLTFSQQRRLGRMIDRVGHTLDNQISRGKFGS